MSGESATAAAQRCPHCGHRQRTITNVESIAANLRKERFQLTAAAPALDAPPGENDLTLCVDCGEFSFVHKMGDRLYLVAPSRRESAALKRDPVLAQIRRKWKRVDATPLVTEGKARALTLRLNSLVSHLDPPRHSVPTKVTGAPMALAVAAPVRVRRDKSQYHYERPAEPEPKPLFRREQRWWPLAHFDATALFRLVGGPGSNRSKSAEAISAALRQQGQGDTGAGSMMKWMQSGLIPEPMRVRMMVTAISKADISARTATFANCLGWGSADLTALAASDLVDGGITGLTTRLALGPRDLKRPAVLNLRALLDSAGRQPADVIDWLQAYKQDEDVSPHQVSEWFRKAAADKYLPDLWGARLLFVLICADRIALREAIAPYET